jgi:hypothetical protein
VSAAAGLAVAFSLPIAAVGVIFTGWFQKLVNP